MIVSSDQKYAHLATLLEQPRDELVLGPVHGPQLTTLVDEGDTPLRVVRVYELPE